MPAASALFLFVCLVAEVQNGLAAMIRGPQACPVNGM
jgi:hypothetical protein